MGRNKPDITLEQAIKKTKEAGFQVVFEKGQTVVGDLFQLQQDIKKANFTIGSIKWIIGVVLVASIFSVITILADYFQFTSQAYKQFQASINEQAIDHKTVETIKDDVQIIKNVLNSSKK